jgi:hypothetical protein
MRILKEDTIAFIIDFQEKLVPVMYNKDILIQNTKKLINGLSILDIPMIVTQQYTKGLGMSVDDIKNVFGEKFHYYDKITFSSYDDEKIKTAIDEKNKKNIIIFGIEAHVCVLQTVIDCIAAGYHVIVIRDCISSRKELDMDVAIGRFIKEGAMISTYESVLFELTRKAGDDTFKKISSLIK